MCSLVQDVSHLARYSLEQPFSYCLVVLLYTVEMSSFQDFCAENTFSVSVACIATLQTVSFDEQKGLF